MKPSRCRPRLISHHPRRGQKAAPRAHHSAGSRLDVAQRDADAQTALRKAIVSLPNLQQLITRLQMCQFAVERAATWPASRAVGQRPAADQASSKEPIEM